MKRLSGMRQPQYRLRIGEFRVFYDVVGAEVRILAVVSRSDTAQWLAEKVEVIITRHGKPSGVLIGFKSEDDWFDYRLENDLRFLQRVAAARQSLEEGRGVRLEDLDD